MRKLLVGAALAMTMAAPLQAQDEPVRGSSFYVGPYVGYMVFGDMWDFPEGELSMDNSPAFGAQAGFSFTPSISLLGNLGWSSAEWTLEDAGTTTTISGENGVLVYDANLQFRLPLGDRAAWMAPFLQAGVGGFRVTTETDDISSERSMSKVAFNAGIGADFQMGRLGLRLMAKDYIVNSEFDDLGDVTWDDNIEGNTAHNWLISLGLNFGF